MKVMKSLYAMCLVVMVVGIVAPMSADGDCQTDRTDMYVDRAITQYNQGQLSGAIADLQEAVRLRPTDANVQFMLGNALYRHGDFEGAARAYGVALEHAPGHFEARMSRGFALYDLGEYEGARREWLAAVQLNTHEAFARAALAVGFYSVGRVEQAIDQYVEAVVLDRRYAEVEELRIDVRWKAESLRVIEALHQMRRDEAVP
jgi:Flp pilus assembly protein TadD